MLRVLWILSLASLTIGARKPPRDEDFEETLQRWASSDQHLASFKPGYPARDCGSSDYESSSEGQCEYDYSKRHPDSSTSKASPVVKPRTRDDLNHGLDMEFDLPFPRFHKGSGGPTRGIPGKDFPDFVDFPATSFSCSDQEWLPGYYADVESRCQVYHACWPDRRDSYLCPVGKIFNQKVLTCDHWYNSKCSLAPHYYSINRDLELIPTTGISKEEVSRFILADPARMALISQFLPVKSKIRTFPETSDSKSKTFAKRTKRHISTTESPDFTQEPQSTTEATVTEEAQHSTQSPDCPEIIKYINVEAAITLFFDRLDNFVKDLLIREAKEYMAASDAKKSCSTAHADKISESEKNEHKLFPRPLVPPMGEEEEPVIASKTDAVDPTADYHKKPVDSRIKRSRPTISPLTKTALIENYIKLLLKLR